MHVWGDMKQEMHIYFSLENINEVEDLTALSLNGKVTLLWIFMKWVMKLWTEMAHDIECTNNIKFLKEHPIPHTQ